VFYLNLEEFSLKFEEVSEKNNQSLVFGEDHGIPTLVQCFPDRNLAQPRFRLKSIILGLGYCDLRRIPMIDSLYLH
jgi:hypothetical protein